MKMQGNTILVAGGAGGIGRGLAELLHRLGNEVIVFGAPGQVHDGPGLRVVDIDLTDPWSVTAFAEQVAATCPELNMLVDISIAFPVKYLPGMQALLDEDETHEKLEAHRLGMQHLAGTLLPHFRKRTHSSVMRLSVRPAFVPLDAQLGGPSAWPVLEGGAHVCALSVRKRWANANIEVVDIAVPSRAERMSPEFAAGPQGVPRVEFISSVAHLLAEGLHEATALSRLRSLWPASQPVARRTRDDDLLSEAY